MSIGRSWWHEILLLAACVGLAAILGVASGYLSGAFLLAGAIYIGWHLLQMLRYHVWMRDGEHYSMPIPLGVWKAAIDGVVELRQSERLREKRLLQMLESFQASTNALPDATLVVDESGTIEWINQSATRLLGISRHDVSRVQVTGIFASPRFDAYLKSNNYRTPIKLTSPVDNGVLLELRVAPFGENKRLLQLRDISRLEQLETIRQDFVANVSHEMRTPLTVIRGYLESMSDAGESMADWQPVLEQMDRQSARLQQIVEDLLLLSRVEQGETTGMEEVVDVPGLLDVLLTEARLLSGERAHRISLQADEKLLLKGHASELRSLFSNLVFNAIAYTPPRGVIEIRWFMEGGSAVFSVLDTGIGIEQQHIPRLTERFYRVDEGRSRKSGGTGLGLAIVKHVLNSHDGRLVIESRYGSGSTFICRFPSSHVSKSGGA
ncbi:phosphate regulon sensor histidine kinase PhoR [Solemya elarraichensis gill symbiont]|uniref:Phosphate regulon sensor protein PhoR n=1 Tax=Solemya elarraichensis gill symbiont TaxID=1918949 RepID=A0A1T2LDD5_9GAMM|nr:phosphate regulon sensor histidine kinase PhoR [Solemya elarraichensis gill symbiont]OOZ43103.1 phosphate regulon sensor histidine kinase PhoR [Solemya elarraichensis gill symbiont]